LRESDPAKRADLLRIACDGGNAEGCNRLGVLYFDGRGVPKDRARAHELHRKACDGGNAWGCHNLGKQYLEGEVVARDPAIGAGLLQKACDGGIPESCNRLGLLCDEGKAVPKDEARAVALYAKACDVGLSSACNNLAISHRDGTGVAKDAPRAMQLFRKACGDATPIYNACNAAGVLAYSGDGVEKDIALAAGLLVKACEGGFARGCYNVASMYRDGVHFEKDAARAEALMKRACDGGVREACTSAGPAEGAPAASPGVAATPAPGPTSTPAAAPAGETAAGKTGERGSAIVGFAKVSPLALYGTFGFGPAFVRAEASERLGIGRYWGGVCELSFGLRYYETIFAHLDGAVMSFPDERPFTNETTAGTLRSTVYGLSGGGAVGLMTPPLRIGAGRSAHHLAAGLGVGYEASNIARVIEQCSGCDHQQVRVQVGGYLEPSLTWSHRWKSSAFGAGLYYRIFNRDSDLISIAILRLSISGWEDRKPVNRQARRETSSSP
jgi:TPR repeat protein